MMNINITSSELLERIFKNYISLHETNILKEIETEGFKPEILQLMKDENLIFKLKDVSSWQRQYKGEFEDKVILTEAKKEVYELTILKEKIITDLEGNILDKSNFKTLKEYLSSFEKVPKFTFKKILINDI